MKKFIAGVIMGAILTTSFTALADSMIGKKVDSAYPLKINGEKAAMDAIVIEGISYLPIRAAGEMFGYNVDFVNWEVTLDNRKQQLVKDVTLKVSSVPELNADGTKLYMNRDGEDYVSVSCFLPRYVNWDGNQMSVTVGEKQITFSENQFYEPGIEGFFQDYRGFVKLSTFGLKATVNGNEMTIEKI